MTDGRPAAVVDEPGLFETPQAEVAYLRSKISDLSSLIDISIIINATHDIDVLIGLVMEKAQSVMRAEASSVMMKVDDTDVLECAVALGEVGEQVQKMQLKIGEGIAGWVALHGEAQIVPDVQEDSRFSSKADRETGFETRSILAVPLKIKEKLIGVAEVINRVDGKAFDNDDLELFSTFSRLVAMAIDNTKVYQLELAKQKMQQELDSAMIIQESFLPTLPETAGKAYSVAANSAPAKTIGGDIFDFIEVDENTIGVAVGDVTGKGVPAALYMARLVSDFRLYTQIYRNPATVLKAMNKVLVERSRRGMFVTFQYGMLDLRSGQFTYANAGHIPFIRRRSQSKFVDLIDDGKGIPLGISPDIEIEERSVRLNLGDIVVLVTDGILEAKNEKGEGFTLERTLGVLMQAGAGPDDVISELLAAMKRFTRDAAQHDDQTILALKWR